MEAAPALMIGGGAAGAATSVAGAIANNLALTRTARSARDAAQTQLNQNAVAAAQQRLDLARESNRVAGRIRLAAAEAGSGIGGSFAALQRQNALDAGGDRQVINFNEGANAARILSGFDADLLSLEARTSNPLIAGLSGGLQGFNTGLSIINAGESILDARRERDRLEDARRIIE